MVTKEEVKAILFELKSEDNVKNRLSIFQKRYEMIREEIIMHLEYRYKVFEILLIFIPTILGFMVYTQYYELSFLASFVTFASSFLFVGENKSLVILANYLVMLEEVIDKEYELPFPGWETWSRSSDGKKMKPSRFLMLGFSSIFFVSYSIFNFIGCFLSKSLREMLFFVPPIVDDFTFRAVIFSLLELSVLLILYPALRTYTKYWLKKQSLSNSNH